MESFIRQCQSPPDQDSTAFLETQEKEPQFSLAQHQMGLAVFLETSHEVRLAITQSHVLCFPCNLLFSYPADIRVGY